VGSAEKEKSSLKFEHCCRCDDNGALDIRRHESRGKEAKKKSVNAAILKFDIREDQ
jgi:hypothetical protein